MDCCKIHGKKCKGECIDPNIDNGMMTKVWGPPGWLFLHCITFGYPYKIDENNPKHTNKKQQFKNFFHYLGHVMPCKYCRNSYIQFMNELPIDNSLNSRKDLCKWLYDIHNKINNKLGIPNCDIPSFDEIQKIYESLRAKCSKTTDEERENNKAKGCVTPADGTPRRSLLKIIKCTRGDITRRENAQKKNEPYEEDYVFIKRRYLYLIIILICIIILISWNRFWLLTTLKKY